MPDPQPADIATSSDARISLGRLNERGRYMCYLRRREWRSAPLRIDGAKLLGRDQPLFSGQSELEGENHFFVRQQLGGLAELVTRAPEQVQEPPSPGIGTRYRPLRGPAQPTAFRQPARSMAVHVKDGVSRSVYLLAAVRRSAMSRSRKRPT